MITLEDKISHFVGRALVRAEVLHSALMKEFDYRGYQNKASEGLLLKVTETFNFIELLQSNSRGGLSSKELDDLIDFFIEWLDLNKVIAANYINYSLPIERINIIIEGGKYATIQQLNAEIVSRNIAIQALLQRIIALETNQGGEGLSLPLEFFDLYKGDYRVVFNDDERLHIHDNKAELDQLSPDDIINIKALQDHYQSLGNPGGQHVTQEDRDRWDAYSEADNQKFDSDINVVLTGGKTFGKYTNGQVIPAAGLTPREVILMAVGEYLPPAFTSFTIPGQATTVEVGTTLTGNKTFTWGINQNSGEVNVIDIMDVTEAEALAEETDNDGSEEVTINTVQLNSNGANQQFRGVMYDEESEQNFNSSIFTITARFYRFFGPVAAAPTNSGEVRALGSSAFHTGVTTFILLTGSVQKKFVVALPPGVTIASVIDLDALGANITSAYVLVGTVNVEDAGGTNRAYNIYEMNVAVAYSTSHRHQITTAL